MVERCYRDRAVFNAVCRELRSKDAAVRAQSLAALKLIDKHFPTACTRSLIRAAQRLRETSEGSLDITGFLEEIRNEIDYVSAHVNQDNLMTLDATPRTRNESQAEQAVRRRRREAIVLNEGDHPLTQQDIIQRRTT